MTKRKTLQDTAQHVFELSIESLRKFEDARDPILAVLKIYGVFPDAAVKVRRVDDEENDD